MAHKAYAKNPPAGYDYGEPCPNCDGYIAIKVDPDDPSYEVFCPVCGEVLMLCTLCHDDFGDCCDWNPKNGCSRRRKA